MIWPPRAWQNIKLMKDFLLLISFYKCNQKSKTQGVESSGRQKGEVCTASSKLRSEINRRKRLYIWNIQTVCTKVPKQQTWCHFSKETDTPSFSSIYHAQERKKEEQRNLVRGNLSGLTWTTSPEELREIHFFTVQHSSYSIETEVTPPPPRSAIREQAREKKGLTSPKLPLAYPIKTVFM